MDKVAQGERAGLAAQIPPAAFTVREFCWAHRISRALFYLMMREGRGPRVMKARRRTLITAEAAAEWRQRMESASVEAA
jgi:hypothetical protein